MSPGETTWTVPWMIDVDEDNRVHLSAHNLKRNHKPGGTVSLKVIKDEGGVYLDATALSQEEVSETFEPKEVVREGDMEVLGVLYPIISDSRGLNTVEVAAFNEQQEQIHREFAEYMTNTFGADYQFAWQEYPGYRSLGDLLHDPDK